MSDVALHFACDILSIRQPCDMTQRPDFGFKCVIYRLSRGVLKLGLVLLPKVVSVPTWRPKDGDSQIKPMLLKCFQGNVAAKGGLAYHPCSRLSPALYLIL